MFLDMHDYKQPVSDKKTNSNLLKENQEYENSSDGDSSEGGTYTLDKDDTALQKAREEIEEVFGIKPETCSNDKVNIL